MQCGPFAPPLVNPCSGVPSNCGWFSPPCRCVTMGAGCPGMTAPGSVGSLGRNASANWLRHSTVTDVSTVSSGRRVARIVGPRYGRPTSGSSDQYPHVLVAGRLGWNRQDVDSLAATVKLLPPPRPSSTGGTGRGSTHFLNRGVAPAIAGDVVGKASGLSATPAAPTAPRSSSCLRVSITSPSQVRHLESGAGERPPHGRAL